MLPKGYLGSRYKMPVNDKMVDVTMSIELLVEDAQF